MSKNLFRISGTALVEYLGTDENEVSVPEGITEIAEKAFYWGNMEKLRML